MSANLGQSCLATKISAPGPSSFGWFRHTSPPEAEIPSVEDRVQGYVDSGYFEQYGHIFYPDVCGPSHAPPPPPGEGVFGTYTEYFYGGIGLHMSHLALLQLISLLLAYPMLCLATTGMIIPLWVEMEEMAVVMDSDGQPSFFS